MIARLRAAWRDWRATHEVPDGWETPEAHAQLSEIIRQTTEERPALGWDTSPPPVPYTPRRLAAGEARPTPGYRARRDGSQDLEDTGYMISRVAYYRARGRQPLRQWWAGLLSEPWGFLRRFEDIPRDPR